MKKRAVDLSIDKLAAIGTKASAQAVQRAKKRGLVITGTIDTYNGKQSVSSLAQLHPSGTVTVVKSSLGVSKDKTPILPKSPTRTSQD